MADEPNPYTGEGIDVLYELSRKLAEIVPPEIADAARQIIGMEMVAGLKHMRLRSEDPLSAFAAGLLLGRKGEQDQTDDGKLAWQALSQAAVIYVTVNGTGKGAT